MSKIGELMMTIVDLDASLSIITAIGEKLRGKTREEKERMAPELEKEVRQLVEEEKRKRSESPTSDNQNPVGGMGEENASAAHGGSCTDSDGRGIHR